MALDIFDYAAQNASTHEVQVTVETVEIVEPEKPKKRGRRSPNKVKVDKEAAKAALAPPPPQDPTETPTETPTEEPKKFEYTYPKKGDPIMVPSMMTHDWTSHPDWKDFRNMCEGLFTMVYKCTPNDRQLDAFARMMAPLAHNATKPKEGEEAKPSFMMDMISVIMLHKAMPFIQEYEKDEKPKEAKKKSWW